MKFRARLAAALLGTALACSLAPDPKAEAALPAAGQGWSVAIIGPTGQKTGRVLTLISPGGAQYPIRKIGYGWEIIDVSMDGRRVLVEGLDRYDEPIQSLVEADYNTQTQVGENHGPIRLDKTDPLYLLMVATESGHGARYSAQELQAQYSGTLDGHLSQSPDGKLVLAGEASAKSRLTVLNTFTGATKRLIGVPSSTYSYCMASRWDSTTTFIGTCIPRSATVGDTTVFRFSSTGAAPVALTTLSQAASQPAFHLADIWTTGKGKVVLGVPGNLQTCKARFGLVNGTKVTMYAPPQPTAEPIGLIGNSLYYAGSEFCGNQSVPLSRYDVVTGKTVLLAGGTKNPGMTVYSAMVIDKWQ